MNRQMVRRRTIEALDDLSLSSDDDDDDSHNKLGDTLVRATKFLGTIVKKGLNDSSHTNREYDRYDRYRDEYDAAKSPDADQYDRAANYGADSSRGREEENALNERYEEANKGNLYSCIRSVRHTDDAMMFGGLGGSLSSTPAWLNDDDDDISFDPFEEGSEESMSEMEENEENEGNRRRHRDDDHHGDHHDDDGDVGNGGRHEEDNDDDTHNYYGEVADELLRRASSCDVSSRSAPSNARTDEYYHPHPHHHHQNMPTGPSYSVSSSSAQSSSSNFLLNKMGDSVKNLFSHGGVPSSRRASNSSAASDYSSRRASNASVSDFGFDDHASANHHDANANGKKAFPGTAAANIGVSIHLGVGAISDMVAGGKRLARNNNSNSNPNLQWLNHHHTEEKNNANGGGGGTTTGDSNGSFNGSFNSSYASSSASGGMHYHRNNHNQNSNNILSNGPDHHPTTPSPSTFTGHHAKSRAKFMKRNVSHAAKSSESFRNLQMMMKEKGAVTGNAVVHMLQEVAEEHAVQENSKYDGMGLVRELNDVSMDLSHIMLDKNGNDCGGEDHRDDASRGMSQVKENGSVNGFGHGSTFMNGSINGFGNGSTFMSSMNGFGNASTFMNFGGASHNNNNNSNNMSFNYESYHASTSTMLTTKPTSSGRPGKQVEESLQQAQEARLTRLEQDPMFGGSLSSNSNNGGGDGDGGDGSTSDNNIRPYIAIPSRESKAEELIEVFCRAADHGRSCLLNVHGPRFAGKTRLVRQALDTVQIRGMGYTVLSSSRSADDALTSFFSFRGIVSMALRAYDAVTSTSDDAPVEKPDDDDNGDDRGDDESDEAIVQRLVRRKILNKSDRLMIGRILPAVMSDQLLSLLKGRSPTALTKDIVDTLFKIMIPLQPVALLFEADGDDCNVDPSSWDLMEELLLSANKQCPQMLLVAMSRRPLRSNIPESLRDEYFVDLHVERMDRRDTESYVRALFCDPNCIDRNMRVDSSVVDGVYGRARGCPLFTERIVLWSQMKEVIELDETRNAVALNLPSHHNDHDHSDEKLSNVLLETLPANLNEEILEVINNLPHHLLDALKMAASMGITFDVNKYETLKNDEGLHSSLQEVTASHRIFEEKNGRYKWKHVAVYEAVESIIISNERIEIQNRIADSLLRDGKGFDGGANAHQYARHYVMAERWDEAFDRYMEAGGQAELKLDFIGAVGMYNQAKMCLKKSRRKPSLQRKLSPHAALGWCLRELVRYDDAEKELEFCLKQTMAVPVRKRNSQFQEIELDVVTTLASLKQAQSKYGEAAKMFERALPIARANKEKHTRVWLAHHVASCAEIYRKSGDLEQAKTLHTEALGYRELAVEEQSCTILELALSFTQLGCTLSGLGDHSRAYSLHKKALAARVEHLDFFHGLVSESLNYCADALQALRRGGEGVPLGMHAVKIRKFVFGRHHPAYAHALSVLASCYHSVGRSFDSLGLLRECLEICEKAFSKNHANMIPNLRLYGSVLSATGKNEKARDVYERAIRIHNMNFKEGQNALQLVKLENALKELISSDSTESQAAKASLEMPIPSFEPDDGARTHVIICADIGHRASDDYMLSVAASLQQMGDLKLISVIAVRPPQMVRANIARGALDGLLLSNVPVAYSGVVSTPSRAAAGGAATTTFDADYGEPSLHVNNTGVELITRALLEAPEKSLVIMGTACLGDISEVIHSHRNLFASKVKRVVVVGSVKHVKRRSFIVPEEACGGGEKDHAFAKNVYRSCQDLKIPTVTLFKDVSLGFPFPSSHVDDLILSNHMISTKIQRSEEMQANRTWELTKQPKQETSRSSYSTMAAGSDNKSFYKYSLGGKHPNTGQHNIWPSIKSINLELVLGLLSCIPVYRDSHFRWETHQVKGIDHKVCRHSNASAGIIKSEALSNEIHMLIGFAFRTSLQNTSC